MKMARNFKILFALAAISLLLVSCKSEQTESSGSFKRAQIPKPAPVEEPAPARIYKLDAAGSKVARRNPFLSYVILSRDAGKVVKIKGPLECCDLNLFRLVAVVVSSENSYALVESPGKKRYIVRRGDFIGAVGGKITRINTRSITVREHDRDSTGKIISTSDEELRLPTNRKTKR
jgi:Tfp pilus assembly protein PilP